MFSGLGWIGLGWTVLDISMILPAVRIVRWLSVLHLRKTSAIHNIDDIHFKQLPYQVRIEIFVLKLLDS